MLGARQYSRQSRGDGGPQKPCRGMGLAWSGHPFRRIASSYAPKARYIPEGEVPYRFMTAELRSMIEGRGRRLVVREAPPIEMFNASSGPSRVAAEERSLTVANTPQ